MEKESLRQVVLEALRSQPRTQFSGVKGRVRNLVADYDTEYDLLLHEILWELLVQGVLAPGMNSSNLDFPYIHVTDYGMRLLESGGEAPSEVDDYLEKLEADLPLPLDELARTYIQEARLANQAEANIAAMTMLGIATETLVDLVFLAMGSTLNDQEKRNSYFSYLAKIRSDLRKKFAFLRTELYSWDFSEEIRTGIDLHLSALYYLMRLTRNEVGMPEGTPIDDETVKANFLLFPGACRWIYGILNDFSQRSGKAETRSEEPLVIEWTEEDSGNHSSPVPTELSPQEELA